MTSVFILYNIDSSLVVGSYSSLELAITNGQKFVGCCECWCIIESKLDETPKHKINNVYQNDIES